MSAVKLIADRILPTQSFTHSSKGSNSVQINISGLAVDVQQNRDCSSPKEVVQEKEDDVTVIDVEAEPLDGELLN
jgi:hypothetical protein